MSEEDSPLEVILTELESRPLVVNGVNMWGKSQAVMTLVEECMNRGWVVKVFDISNRWLWNNPVPNKQHIRSPLSYYNVGNCVYDIALLGVDERRELIGNIMKTDWLVRYDGTVKDQYFLDRVPRILYVFEEGNCYFTSRDINKRDETGKTLTDFMSTRRNYKQSGLLITSAVNGEVATKLRRRCNYLLGRISNEKAERYYLRKGTSDRFMDTLMQLNKPYHFLYYGNTVITKPFTFTMKRYGDPSRYGEDLEFLQLEPLPRKREGNWFTRFFGW